MSSIKLVVTDLDGTLLKDDKSISKEDVTMLSVLKKKQIFRVAATGRNMNKVVDVIPSLSIFDYIAFSSGAGIYDCRNDKLIYSRNIDIDAVNELNRFLINRDVSFYLSKSIPDNMYYWFYKGNKECNEFAYFFRQHEHFLEELPANGEVSSQANQYLIIFKDYKQFCELKENIECFSGHFKILRASSPYLTRYIWMEIFHKDVSKGNAVRFLCNHLDVNQDATIGIGNDYNDLDLLEFTYYSYLADNGPEELKSGYLPAPCNEKSAFSFCINNHINK